jgi:hypothetical protein
VFVCFRGDGGVRCSRFITDLNGVVSLDIAETASLVSGSGSSLARYAEPAIAMDSSGTLFGVWTEEFDGVPELVLARRVASGTWEYRTVDRQGYEAGDYASIAIADVAGTKKICVGWSWSEVAVSCTDDEGASWNTSVVLSDEWAAWRPSVAIASDGIVNVAWAGDSHTVRFARELKDKKSGKWEVVEVDTHFNVMDVKLALDDKDLAHLVYPGKSWTTMMYTKEIPVIPTSPSGR